MKFVIVESPYAAPTQEGIEENINYARACIRDCLLRGEAPFASHLLYTQIGVLKDEIPSERMHGINSGLELAKRADITIVYMDRGISKGMQYGIDAAKAANRPIEYRYLNKGKE